jgi:hypothetical protein
MAPHIDPAATATPAAKRAFFSPGSFTFRFRTQLETTMAQIRWSIKVKGVIVKGLRRFRTNPTPDMRSALEVETSVMLSHRGVVSNKR